MNRMYTYKPQDLTVTDLAALEIELAELSTRRRFLIGAGGLIGAAALGACGTGEEAAVPTTMTGGTRTFTHALGEIEVPVEPRRIASLHDTIVTYLLFDLGFKPIASAGVEEQIRVGDNDVSDLAFLGQVTDPNIEQIAVLAPDLIIGLESNNGDQYDQLSQIAPTVLFASPDSLFDYHRRLADLVNRLPEYEALVRQVDQRTEDMKARLDQISPELEVSTLSAVAVDQIFTIYGPANPYMVAFDRLGLRFPAAMPPNHGSVNEFFSLERLPDFDADIIFLLSGVGTTEALRELQEQPLFKALNAFQKGQVFTVSYDEWLYTRIPGILSVYDDIEHYLLSRELDVSGDFS